MNQLPWLVDGAIDFLKNYLTTTSVVLEFGMGQSTIWFANRVKTLVSMRFYEISRFNNRV